MIKYPNLEHHRLTTRLPRTVLYRRCPSWWRDGEGEDKARPAAAEALDGERETTAEEGARGAARSVASPELAAVRAISACESPNVKEQLDLPSLHSGAVRAKQNHRPRRSARDRSDAVRSVHRPAKSAHPPGGTRHERRSAQPLRDPHAAGDANEAENTARRLATP